MYIYILYTLYIYIELIGNSCPWLRSVAPFGKLGHLHILRSSCQCDAFNFSQATLFTKTSWGAGTGQLATCSFNLPANSIGFPLVYSWYRSSFLPIDWVGSLKSPAVAERLNLQDCHWHSSDVYQTSGKVYQGMLIPTKSQKVPASVVHKTIPGICWLADQLHHIDKGATESEVSVWPSCWVKAPKLIVRQCVSLQLASFPSKCCWRAGRKAPFPGNHCVRMDSDGQCLIEFSWAFCIAHRDSRTKKMRLGARVNP